MKMINKDIMNKKKIIWVNIFKKRNKINNKYPKLTQNFKIKVVLIIKFIIIGIKLKILIKKVMKKILRRFKNN